MFDDWFIGEKNYFLLDDDVQMFEKKTNRKDSHKKIVKLLEKSYSYLALISSFVTIFYFNLKNNLFLVK